MIDPARNSIRSSAGRVAAVTVLYHPQDDVVTSVESYLGQVEHLYLIDNSDGADHQILFDGLIETGQVSYYCQDNNTGIATALNKASGLASAAGFDWLLTMDQDSQAAAGMVQEQLKSISALSGERVGMIAPFHITKATGRPPEILISDVMTPMTSGCLLNLGAYREVGGFREDFFIDFVDNEYCLRLRRNGWQVLRANRALLTHNVGDISKYGPFIATNHSPLRRYYKTRNRFRVFREYVTDFPGHCLFDMVRLTKEVGSIVLFEKNKREKLLMMIRGAVDFFRCRYGRYDAAGQNNKEKS